MKRLLSLLLVLGLLMCFPVVTHSNEESELPFTDVSRSKWYYDAIKSVYEAGIMEGISQDSFTPEAVMTRSQAVTILYRLSGTYETGFASYATFSDVNKSDWYIDYLGWAVKEELVKGYPEGDFRPNNPITRQELAKLIVEFLKYVIATVESESRVDSFNDSETFADWSKDYIESLRTTGLMQGDDQGNFNPLKTATRAEVATVIVRMLPFVEEALAPLPPPMGWNGYMLYNWRHTEERIIGQMDAMIDTGLHDAGYEYINIDDWWYTTRDEETDRVLVWEELFPNGMKYIADQAHARGLKAGIYTDLGYNSCGSGNEALTTVSGINVGLHAGYYKDDLWRYVGVGEYMDKYATNTGTDPIECWGFDFIKVDSNGTKEGVPSELVLPRYAKAIDEIERKTGRRIHFNMCRWFFEAPYQMVYGDSWRCGGDSVGQFSFVADTIDKMKRVSSYTTPGHYADLDMFVFGRDMTLREERTNFAMWCMFSSPLILSCDLASLSEDQLEFLTDKELIAIDQDPLCYAAAYMGKLGDTTELWFKKTESYDSGTSAIAIYNPGDTAEEITLSLSDFCNSGKADVRNVSTKKDLGVLDTITVTVESHDAIIYTLNTDKGYTSDHIGDYRVYGVLDTDYKMDFDDTNCDGIVTVTMEEYEKSLSLPPAFRDLLIDVRTPEEFAKGHLEGAINVPYKKVAEAIVQRKLPLLTADSADRRTLLIYASDEQTLNDAYMEFAKFRYDMATLGVITEFD